jgi:hypothetical protein
MKTKANLILLLVILSNFVLLQWISIFPTTVFAQATATQTVNSDLVNLNDRFEDYPQTLRYGGVEGSIERLLCTPSDQGDHDLSNCINKLYRFAVAIGAFAAVFFLVLAGYFYIVGGQTAKEKGKHMLVSTLVGLVILLGSWLILNQINPNLTAFRTIQPPALSGVPELPQCIGVGLIKDCIISGTADRDENDGESTGSVIACQGGLVKTKDLGLVTDGSNSSEICKDLGVKLVAAAQDYNQATGEKYYFLIGQTISSSKGPSVSSCHYYGAANTGNCADLSPREKGTNAKPGNSDKDPWNKLCSSLAKQGIDVLVELIDISGCGHKPSKPTNATGPHYHVSLKSGGGSGGSTQSSIPGVRSWQGNPPASGSLTAHRYQDGDWSNTDPDLKAAFDQLKQKYSPLTTGQVYRPQGYADHMRSIWEAYN